MIYSEVSVLLLVAACGGWLWLALRDAPGVETRSGLLLRLALVGAAGLGHWNLLDLGAGRVLTFTTPVTHVHEVFHYHLGTRYFAELGYTDLYHAVLLAEVEDTDPVTASRGVLRDLRSNQVVARSDALPRAREVREAFSDERWQAFKRDVAAYRERSPGPRWRYALQDHGYNGTPVTTALLGTLAQQPWIPTERLLHGIGWLDPLLVGAFALLLCWREGAGLALAFLFFTFANPLNDASYIGASYLRYAWFVALAAGLWALRREQRASAGVLLACAGWLRIFPLAIYGALLLHDLWGPGWRERLRASRWLHAAFGLASLALLGLGASLTTPDGRDAWLAFADNLRVHSTSVGANQASLGVAVAWSPERDRLRGDEHEWAVLRDRRARAPWQVAAALPLLALAALALRRAPGTTAVLPALLAVYCVLPVTHYDWLVLSVLPLVLIPGSEVRRALPLLFAALAVTGSRDLLHERPDTCFALVSLELGLYLAWACARLWRRRSAGAPSAHST